MAAGREPKRVVVAVGAAGRPGVRASGRPASMARVGSVDALVIAALPLEFDAAREVGRAAGVEWRPENADDRTPYLSGEYKTADGKQVTVALARPTEMGGRRTGTFVTTLANHLRPACLAMSGVCAGNPDDTAPGDVIVAAPAYEYDEGKQSGDTFQGAHQQYPLNDRWLRAAQDFDPAGLPSHGEATDDEATIWFLERLHKGQDARKHPARSRYFARA
jgi:nucleoside phosphorylase